MLGLIIPVLSAVSTLFLACMHGPGRAPVSCFGGKQLAQGAHYVAREPEEKQFGAKSESKAPDPTGLGERFTFMEKRTIAGFFTS